MKELDSPCFMWRSSDFVQSVHKNFPGLFNICFSLCPVEL